MRSQLSSRSPSPRSWPEARALACASACALAISLAISLAICPSPTQAQVKVHDLRVAVSAAGAVQGSFITKPDNEYYRALNLNFDVPYSGYGGVGGAAALSAEVAWKVLGLSVGYLHGFDSAKGKIDGQALSLSQTTHHIPITLRAELPSALVRPSLFGGIDWVSASSTTLESYPGSLYKTARAESYQAWMFGLGFDFMLTPQLRLPVRLYGIFNPAKRDSLNDAISPQFSLDSPSSFGTFELRSEWTWQAGVSVGVSFDVYQR
jgi:hypothetical protein